VTTAPGVTLGKQLALDVQLLVEHFKSVGLFNSLGRSNSSTLTDTPIYVYNDSGAIVPAYACMQVTETREIGGQNYLDVKKPADTDGTAGGYLFNGSSAIEIGGKGIAQKGPVVRCYKNSGTVTAGGVWGPTVSQWYLTVGSGPFIATGDDNIATDVFKVIVDTEKAMVCKTSGSGIAARSGTTVSSGTCTIWSRSGTTLSATSTTITVYNLSTAAVGNTVYIVATMTNIGWVAVWEDC
jgi:hypothetical protein